MKTNSTYSRFADSRQLRNTGESKNTGRIVNQVNSPDNKARVGSSTASSASPLYHRNIEKKEVAPEAPQPKPGLVGYNFKIKSKDQISAITAMPLGSQGMVTTWNPEGLSAKELLKKKYAEGKQNSGSTVFGYFYTPYVPLSLDNTALDKQVFMVKKGFDIAVSITKFNQDRTISAGQFLPYTQLAPKLDGIATRMVQTFSKDDTGYNEKTARHRIAGDIIRVGSGDQIKGKYTSEEWHNLAEFAMVIRADKARAPGSTRHYIDPQIRDHSTSFKDRFGNGAMSLYEGAPKGGAKKIKDRQPLCANLPDPELTDTRSDTPPRSSRKN